MIRRFNPFAKASAGEATLSIAAVGTDGALSTGKLDLGVLISLNWTYRDVLQQRKSWTSARRKNAMLAHVTIGWPMAQSSRAGAFIALIPGAKWREHLEENVRAADIVLRADELAEIDLIVPPSAASGTRHAIGQTHRLNL